MSTLEVRKLIKVVVFLVRILPLFECILQIIKYALDFSLKCQELSSSEHVPCEIEHGIVLFINPTILLFSRQELT